MISRDIKEFAKSIENSGAILGIDYGNAKIGIAVSDTSRIIASSREVYERRNMSKDLGYLGKYIEDNKICAVVLGLPLSLDGSEGENCEKIRVFAAKLFKKSNLPILLKDERMSTAAASRALAETGMTRKKRETLDDKVAAAIILQTALDGLGRIA